MSDRLDDDLLDDPMDPEGPAQARHAFDEDPLDDSDDPLALDESDDLDDPHGFEDPHSLDDPGDDPYDAPEGFDEMEEGLVDALDSEDADEFWGRLRNIVRKYAPIVSKVAGAVPFVPGAALIGKAADIIGKVAADEADEMDALEGLAESAEEADEFDAAAPIAAAIALRKAIPRAARLPRPQRKMLLKAATTVTRHIARRHGPAATAAVPAIVRHARRVVVHRRLPAHQLPRIIRRTAAKVARSPHLVRRFARAGARMRTAVPLRHGGRGAMTGWVGRSAYRVGRSVGAAAGRSRYAIRSGGGGACPHCGTRRSFALRGPVRITVESL